MSLERICVSISRITMTQATAANALTNATRTTAHTANVVLTGATRTASSISVAAATVQVNASSRAE